MGSVVTQTPLEPKSAVRVRASFEAIRPHLPAFGRVFYTKLFELNPNIALLFPADPDVQEARFGAMISRIVEELDDPERLTPMLQALGRRHIEDFGARAADFDDFGDALCWTICKFLGEAFTPEVAQAWEDFYEYLAETMIGRRPDPLTRAAGRATHAGICSPRRRGGAAPCC